MNARALRNPWNKKQENIEVPSVTEILAQLSLDEEKRNPWNNKQDQIEVPSMTEILAQLSRDEDKENDELGNERHYKVLHDKVAIRAFASTSAPIIGVRRRGDIIRTVQVDGLWVRLHPEECSDAFLVHGQDKHQWKVRGAEEGWMLVHGGDVGLDKLLERIQVPKSSLKRRQLNREEFEVARSLALGMIPMSAVPQEFRGIREIVLEAVRTDGMALKYVSPELLEDKEIVLNAVMQNPKALKFAAVELQKEIAVS